MALHARCVAVTAGARGDWVEKIANELVKAGHVKVEKAREIIAALSADEAAQATGTTG
jgi:hydroxymethylglutaryl-CoA reductase